MLNGRLPDEQSARRVIRQACEILRQCTPPGERRERRTGLVIGHIQSGKTLSMAALAALARDNGIRLAIVLAGTTRNLVEQSRVRFETDLRGASPRPWSWHMLTNPGPMSEERETLADTIRLWGDPAAHEHRKKAVFITVMKHHNHLRNLTDLLGAIDLAGVPALIIDDEADQAGLDTRPTEPEPSTTYRRIVELRRVVPNHTYLQFTATPQAPLLISLVDILSPEFAALLEPGEGYTGGRAFFLENPHLIRRIPREEIPEGALAANTFDPPQSLLEALRLFFVGAVCGEIAGDGGHRSMLVHPHQLTAIQSLYARWVRQVKERWYNVLSLPDNDPDKRELANEFLASYRDLAATARDIPPWDQVRCDLAFAVNSTVVTVVNSDTGSEVDWRNAYSHILVGGQKLNRGYTVEGLTVTYMPREPGTWTADTIQQRARFFGYRQGYLDFCRVYLHPDILEGYRNYVDHEEGIRSQLAEHEGRPLAEWRRAFYLERRYRPTRLNILREPYTRPSLAGRWFYVESPHASDELIERNRGLVARFLTSVELTPHPTFAQHLQSDHVPLGLLLRDLIAQYGFYGRRDLTSAYSIICALAQHADDNPDASALVLQMDAGQCRVRSEGERGRIQIPQGRSSSPIGPRYPGDREIYNPNLVTVQINSLSIPNPERALTSVPAIGIRLPQFISTEDIVVQAQSV